MKAPRKTVKRPIFRYNESYDKRIQEEEKEGKNILTMNPESKFDTLDAFDSPMIEFEAQLSFISSEPLINLIDEVVTNIIESYNEDINPTGPEFEFLVPIEFDEIE